VFERTRPSLRGWRVFVYGVDNMAAHRNFLITFESKDGKVRFDIERFKAVKDKNVESLKRRKDVVAIDVVMYIHNDAEKLIESWKRRRFIGMFTKFWKKVDKG
jgi:hypothetical protein